MQSDYPRNTKPNSSAFASKPFTYLPTLPPGTTPSAIIEQSAIVNPVNPIQKTQKPLPVPPVRSSSTVLSTVPNKEPITQNGNGSIQNVLPKTGPKPRPPVPPRGETTRLTTVSKGPGFNNYVNTAPKTVESKFETNNSELELPVKPYAGSVIDPPPPQEIDNDSNVPLDKENHKSNSVNSFHEPGPKPQEQLVRKSSIKSPEESKEKYVRKPSFESGSGKISSELEAKFNKILQAQESQEKLSRNASQESDSSQKQTAESEVVNGSDKTNSRRTSQDSIEKPKRNSVEIPADTNVFRKNSSEDTVDHVLPRSSSRNSITKKPSADSIEELKAQIPEHLEKEDVFLQNFEGKFKRNYSEELIDHQSRAETCVNKYRRHFSEDLGSAKPPEDVSKYLRRNYSAESCETDETSSTDELNVENSSTIRVETLINALSIVNTKSETNLAEVVKDEPVKSLIKTVEQSLSTDIINKVAPDDQSKETSSEDEEGATADIWVRTIESPVKRKPPPGIAEKAEDKENEIVSSEISIVSDEVPNSTDDSNSLSQLATESNEEETKDSKSLAPHYTGTESLPCSRAGSRVASRSSSPAFFGTENKPKERISAAEALGVIPKLPGPRLTQFAKSSAEIFRRQSLGNLADSKVGGAYGRSSWAPSAVLTDVEGSSSCDTYDYRRKKFSKRCASVEGSKTLARNARLNTSTSYDSDSGKSVLDAKPSPYSYYHTLSRIGPNSRSSELDPKYFPKSTAIPPITGYSSLESYPDARNEGFKQRSLSQGSYRQPKSDTLPSGRPKSTCSCGHHLASSIRLDSNVSKRTYSVEELAGNRGGGSSGYSSDFGRSSSTSRSSFGKSQRVTFALDEDMGAVPTKKCELDKNGLPLKKIMKKPKTSPEFIDSFDKSNIFVDSHGVAHASHCSTLQHGSHCSTLPHPQPSHCSSLPHSQASHCNTLPSSLQQVSLIELES